MKSMLHCAVIAASLGGALTGCAFEPAVEADEVSESSAELYAWTAALRRAPRHEPTTKVSVCFKNPSGYSKEVGWVRDILKNTWSAAAKVEFEGFGKCGSADIPIKISDERPYWVGGFGRDGDEMVLNFTYKNFDPSCASSEGTRRFCIEANAVHEFGHALSLAHEANHPDSKCKDTQGLKGDQYWKYDADSVMNYCAPTRNTLSRLDQEGIAKLYGGVAAYSNKLFGLWNEGNDRFLSIFTDLHGTKTRFTDGVATITIERKAGNGQFKYGDEIYLKSGNKYIYATGNNNDGKVSLWVGNTRFAWSTEKTSGGNGGPNLDVRDPFRMYWTFKNKKHYLSTKKDPNNKKYFLSELVAVTTAELGAEWRIMGDFDR